MYSEELFKISKENMPGGVSSPVRAYKPYPFFAKQASGSKITDIDGKTYIDHCLGYGPLILGHANPKIVEAITDQAQKGTLYGVPTENEIKLSQEIINRVPCADMVRFCNSGTEATMSAIRLARGYTGRDKIVKFEGTYHGAHDYVLVKSGSGAATHPDSKGIPESTTQNTLSVPFNDEEALKELIEEEGNNIACIIMEVVMGNVGCIKPKKGYLDFIRKLTIDYGIILIFDEVITGFRLSSGGAQEYFGVTPDICTFAKILGGGLPIGAIAGKQKIMELFAPNGPVYQAGTFSGNPLSIRAGITALEQLDKSFYDTLNKKGNLLRLRLKDNIEDLGLNLQVNGIGSMFQIYFNPEPVTNYTEAKKSDSDLFTDYFHELLKNGVFIAPSQFECCFLSGAHSDEDLEKTSYAIEKSLKTIYQK
ncbi:MULTISPECIES: glutamate-1-semialdehyde 2,1-aminomutase [Methanobrevibacter]|jgi:glutamate-1-semialdehyde 2,1-aminomutase|uniref:glutamate-1-semialdehyde 2,1-aminomutase n=1 Tax=Methanobrevibacter TaxID=2172 RepID=UPI00375C7E2E|nr:glutamate-1-semialdehyde 2,1-aminomutase [Methanobacteriaceae archaeon]